MELSSGSQLLYVCPSNSLLAFSCEVKLLLFFIPLQTFYVSGTYVLYMQPCIKGWFEQPQLSVGECTNPNMAPINNKHVMLCKK